MRFITAFFSLLSLLPISLVIASPFLSRRDDDSTTTATQVINFMGALEQLVEQFLPVAASSFNTSDMIVGVLEGFLDVHVSQLGSLFDPALGNCTFDFTHIQSADQKDTILSLAYIENLITISSLSFLNNATALDLSSSDQDILRNATNISHLIATVTGSMAGLDQQNTDAAMNFQLLNAEVVTLMKLFSPSCPKDLGLSTLAPNIQIVEFGTPFSPGPNTVFASASTSFTSSCPNADSCSCQIISSATGVQKLPLTDCLIGTHGVGLDMTIITRGNDTISFSLIERGDQIGSYIAMLPIMFAPA